jgi:hypothetical protein
MNLRHHDDEIMILFSFLAARACDNARALTWLRRKPFGIPSQRSTTEKAALETGLVIKTPDTTFNRGEKKKRLDNKRNSRLRKKLFLTAVNLGV